MRLHLGCGDLYLPDALNMDRYDLRVADLKADAVRLPVRSGTSEAVIAYHVFEHLGYMGSVYAFAEAFRVLKPGGILEIETPDPVRSFQAFMERSEPLWRAGVLSWIFGTETTGMGHRGLFPKELLEKMVKEAGFSSLTFDHPKTHRHRWGLRLVARKDRNPSAELISRLRPLLADDVLSGAGPQEALEMEIRLWEPLYLFGRGDLCAEEAEDRILEWMVVAPKIIHAWAGLCQENKSLPVPPEAFPLKVLSRVAGMLVDSHFCSVLRDAFSLLCATVNQVPDGHTHLLGAAKALVKKWLASPPEHPESLILEDLEKFGIMRTSDPNLSYPGDTELAKGRTTIHGRRPCWPRHELFTREHLMERVRWFRDLGIRCFTTGQLDEARQLFRLAINSKLEGLYTVWNMARLQAALGQTGTAEVFYKAAMGFPMPDAIRDRVLSELKRCPSGEPDATGPVSVGEGEDRVLDFLEKAHTERIPFVSSGPSKRSALYPPPKTLLWELTLRCQCRCTHCAAAGGKPRPDELSTEEALDVCDQIAGLGIPSVCLMGGEPLLHPDWEGIASRLRELGLDLGMATNGIALNTQIWRTLERLGFSQVVISLDGTTPEVHDTRRRRKGALKKAQEAIREMRSRPLRERTVVTSVDKGNIGELNALRDWLLENAPGITWMINMASPAPGSRMDRDQAVDVEDFLFLLKFIAENRPRYKSGLDITGTHCMGYFSQRYQDLYNYTWSGCQAGMTTLGLRSDGSVTGCLVMSDRFVEGNVRQRPLGEIWKDPDAFPYNRSFTVDMLKGKCTACRWGDICRGGCRETSFSFTGETFEAPFCLYHLESMGALP